jgi:CheY-like chemotaxis protein
MPLKRIKRVFFGPGPRIPQDLAIKVFKRDHLRCQYCGLDGQRSFENWLILTVDHVHPFVRGGSRALDNLVTACQPCNLIKGKRRYASFEAARKYVASKREEWGQQYREQVARVRGDREESGARDSAPGARVLLVDEDRQDLEYHSVVLHQLGCDVVGCTSYSEGIRHLESQPFDVVMVDQGTREFEGREVLQRAVGINRHLPVVVVTGSVDMSLYTEAMQLGAVDYLQKPLSPSEVVRVLKTHPPGRSATA